MKKILHLLITGLLISCGQQVKSPQTIDNGDSLTDNNKMEVTDTTSTADGEDCVFNNDYKGLTIEWLTESKIKDFIWNDNLKQALIPRGRDTLFISQGGCTHFGFLVEIKLANDTHALTDSVFFIQKAFELATEFDMDHYVKMINEGKLRKAESGVERVWFEVDDDDFEDNIIYNGIEIAIDGQDKRVNISQYVN
jgi:hypothetical protein